VSSCKILWRSNKSLLTYGDFSISFKMVAVHSVGLVVCLDHPRRAFGSIYCVVQKLVGIDAVV